MKKLTTLICVLIAFQFSSCKEEVKKEESKPPVTVAKTFAYSLKTAANKIGFTAYKTTDKVPVKGMFKKIEITKLGEGNTIKEAINGAEFRVPVGNIETNDSSRNLKIVTFFFSVMENTKNLTGKLMINDDNNGALAFKMNGISEVLPFTYTIVDKVFTMKAVMNVDKWNGQAAIASLNEACKDLHKGADGVSKTWSDVDIEVTSTFK